MQPPALNPEADPTRPESGALSFDLPAQPATEAQARSCPRCGNVVSGSYYATAAQEVLCAPCGEAALAAIPPGPGTKGILRALAFGSGAAFVGMIGYLLVLGLTGYEIGYLALAVGWLVGKAVRRGGFARGGRKLQLIAVGLTYLSIVGSYLILGIKELVQKQSGSAVAATSGTGQVKQRQAPPASAPEPMGQPVEPAPGPVSLGQFVFALAALFGLALVIPFLGGFSNILGLIIIAVGLFEAWRINRKPPPDVTGPFSLNASA